MSTERKYCDYFAIDPEYFPVVNEKVINEQPDRWKKFYPHKTFIDLLKSTLSVLERKEKQCLWVEGAYGTGKSHGVLTLKKLLDAEPTEVQEYFERYELDMDLCNRFLSIKTNGKILTVHRYGSANIYGEKNLVFAVQESIEKALAEAGIKNKAGCALKDAALAWLSDEFNKKYFDDLIKNSYADWFGGDDVNKVIEKLNNYTDAALEDVMSNIFKVADDRQIRALFLDAEGLSQWILEVIEKNNLHSIMFIWDEFTEFFYHNTRELTGFQSLCEISETNPFYFVLVTHETQALFSDQDKDFSKLNDRFVKPHCIITLPENIAFQLMGEAMTKNDDSVLKAYWINTVSTDLTKRTKKTRELVEKAAKIDDEDMQRILPIHPYAALLLKQISSAFASNQRSMFDFIKNDSGDEIKGFQWFIDNFGPLDDNPLLTVDMLWDFFYEKGRENLTQEVRATLDYYRQVEGQKMIVDDEQKRVLKAVLLLLAISLNVDTRGKVSELLIPNQTNIENVFEGTDLETRATNCAQQLVTKKILYSKSMGGGNYQYAIYNNEPDNQSLNETYKQIDEQPTEKFLGEKLKDGTTITDVIKLDAALKLRYKLKFVASKNFDSTVKQLRVDETAQNIIIMVVCFAKNGSESDLIKKKIAEAVRLEKNGIVFLDTTTAPFGKDYEYYRNDAALSVSQKENQDLSNQYAQNAKDSLKSWKKRIADGEFTVYTSKMSSGKRAVNMDDLNKVLSEVDRDMFPECPEINYTVNDTMYMPSSLSLGVKCACNEETSGQYRSGNKNKKWETALAGAWKVKNYWESNPILYISKIKIRVDKMVQEKANQDGRIAIREIYDMLKTAPYGFLPCNLTAFLLGFALKEYTNETYGWSDGLTNDVLSVDKLAEMIAEVINLEISPNSRYRDKYIVAMTKEEKMFNELTATAFDIPINKCTCIADTRKNICTKMKELSFPIWTLENVLDQTSFKTDEEVLKNFIEKYMQIANSGNVSSEKSENDIALELGKLGQSYPNAASDLKKLFTQENCTHGMEEYLRNFEGGELIDLANTIGDGGQYINAIRKKFDADEANWVWNKDTANQRIREVILEYRIVKESNRALAAKSNSFDEAIQAWKGKCNNIYLAYTAAKNEFGALQPLVEMLYDLCNTGVLADAKKENFWKLLCENGADFRRFYDNQTAIFAKVCKYYLEEMSDDEIKTVYNHLPKGSFLFEKADYVTSVEKTVQDYKDSLKTTKLRKLWKEKTGTDTPRKWSKLHQMPILSLVPSEERMTARSAFEAVNSKKPSESAVEKALDYFAHAKFFDTLQDENALKKAFQNSIIKDFAVMLPDLQETKESLSEKFTEPYDWCDDPLVENQIKSMAQAKYDKGGYQNAMDKIDQMDDAQVKQYLKDLIVDNMIVGMEIIKNN